MVNHNKRTNLATKCFPKLLSPWLESLCFFFRSKSRQKTISSSSSNRRRHRRWRSRTEQNLFWIIQDSFMRVDLNRFLTFLVPIVKCLLNKQQKTTYVLVSSIRAGISFKFDSYQSPCAPSWLEHSFLFLNISCNCSLLDFLFRNNRQTTQRNMVLILAKTIQIFGLKTIRILPKK